MKGQNEIIWPIVVLVVAVAFWFVVSGGPSTILTIVGGEFNVLSNNTSDQVALTAAVQQCQQICLDCCRTADGTLDERTDECKAVMRNEKISLGDESMLCSQISSCGCNK